MLVVCILSNVCLDEVTGSSLGDLLYLLCNIRGCMCSLAHSSLGHRKDDFVTHLIIIISFVCTLHYRIIIIMKVGQVYSVGCVSLRLSQFSQLFLCNIWVCVF